MLSALPLLAGQAAAQGAGGSDAAVLDDAVVTVQRRTQPLRLAR